MAFGIDDAAIAALIASGQGLGGVGAAGAVGGGLGAALSGPATKVGTTILAPKVGAAAKIGIPAVGTGGAATKTAPQALNSGAWADAAVALAQISQRPPTTTPRPQSFLGIGQPTPPRAQGQVFAPSPQQQQQPVPGLGQFLV